MLQVCSVCAVLWASMAGLYVRWLAGDLCSRVCSSGSFEMDVWPSLGHSRLFFARLLHLQKLLYLSFLVPRTFEAHVGLSGILHIAVCQLLRHSRRMFAPSRSVQTFVCPLWPPAKHQTLCLPPPSPILADP
jgi:hypothetical protein